MDINRRKFLKGIGAGAVGTSLTISSGSASTSRPPCPTTGSPIDRAEIGLEVEGVLKGIRYEVKINEDLPTNRDGETLVLPTHASVAKENGRQGNAVAISDNAHPDKGNEAGGRYFNMPSEGRDGEEKIVQTEVGKSLEREITYEGNEIVARAETGSGTEEIGRVEDTPENNLHGTGYFRYFDFMTELLGDSDPYLDYPATSKIETSLKEVRIETGTGGRRTEWVTPGEANISYYIHPDGTGVEEPCVGKWAKIDVSMNYNEVGIERWVEGCHFDEIVRRYDQDNNCKIDGNELDKAIVDWSAGKITDEQLRKIIVASSK